MRSNVRLGQAIISIILIGISIIRPIMELKAVGMKRR
jgi:hypothetical protein